MFTDDKRLYQGPGALGKALGLNKAHNGIDLQGDVIWIEDQGSSFTEDEVKAAPRDGMNFEGSYKTIPWQFYLKENKFVSKPRS